MLADLPIELQCYIVTFLPARNLVKTLARTDRHFYTIVDSYIQRSVLRILAEDAKHNDSPGESHDRSSVALEFEAQRPIDTVTAKHTLHFRQFSTGTSEVKGGEQHSGPRATQAIFSFSEDSPWELAGRTRARFDAAQRAFVGNIFQPVMPTLHDDDQHRISRGIATSSVDARDRLEAPQVTQPASQQREQNDTGPAESTEPPFPFLRSTRTAAATANTDGAAWSARRRFTTTLAPTETSTVQSLDMPLDAYDWQGPSGASPRTSIAGGGGASQSTAHGRTAGRQPACYAFQLDPLDSFESLILTLTARKCVPDRAAAYTGRSSGRKVRYQRTVAEGLDRVFRTFFEPPPPPPPPPSGSRAADGSTLMTARGNAEEREEQISASMLALLSSFGPVNRLLPRPMTTTAVVAAPPRRTLEFDSASCTLTIQPHASGHPSLAHPAYAGSSHGYLSSPPLTSQYAQAGSHDRVELTFHCEEVCINAARLLACLEELEDAVREAEARARVYWPTVLAGSGWGASVVGLGRRDEGPAATPPQPVEGVLSA